MLKCLYKNEGTLLLTLLSLLETTPVVAIAPSREAGPTGAAPIGSSSTSALTAFVAPSRFSQRVNTFHRRQPLGKGPINNSKPTPRISPSSSGSGSIDTMSATTTTPDDDTKKKRTLNLIQPSEVSLEIKDPVDPTALEQARAILAEIRGGDSSASASSSCDPSKLLDVAHRLGDISPSENEFIVPPSQLEAAFDALPPRHRSALLSMRDRIQTFAHAQRTAITDVAVPIPGGLAGHTVSPCQTAGCYAPGGRYPLPSSVLMTAVTARAAGCDTVVVCSPNPAPITLAAAHAAGADLFLRVGGAQAIGAMAYGVSSVVPKCDVIVGPGNKWVTAAKSIISGVCGIDMLAGPSEVLVIADDTASPAVVAADLIAQAEHDVVARAILLSTSAGLIDAIDDEASKQLAALPEPNRSTALAAFEQSFAVQCDSIEQCVELADAIAPEHLEIQTEDAHELGKMCRNYGGLFVGAHAAEVLGDYGAGPNHTLPTGGTGRYTGGLSVLDFLRVRTWMRIDDNDAEECQEMVEDSIVMARLEGLEGHARAAEMRRSGKKESGGD